MIDAVFKARQERSSLGNPHDMSEQLRYFGDLSAKTYKHLLGSSESDPHRAVGCQVQVPYENSHFTHVREQVFRCAFLQSTTKLFRTRTRACGSRCGTRPAQCCVAPESKCKLSRAHVRHWEICEMSRESLQVTALICACESIAA
jgi:hypothetical protein